MVWVHCRKWSYILGEARQREEEKSGAKHLHMFVKEKKMFRSDNFNWKAKRRQELFK